MGKIQFVEISDYHQKMNAVYDNISSNPVGKVIISDIEATSKNLIFKPRTKTDIDTYGKCDAGTHALDEAAARPKGVGDKGPAIWYTGNLDNPMTPNTDERHDPSNMLRKPTTFCFMKWCMLSV
jgi:hypothetical protein